MARTILSSFSCLCFFFCSQPLWHQVWLHSLVNIVSPCIYTIIDSLYRCTIILFSISRCTEICTKKMYTILQTILYSAVVTIPCTHILSFFSKPVLVWAYIHGTIPHIQCKIPSSLPPGFSTCKIFQFCPFYSFAVLTVLHGKGFIFSSSKSLSRWAGLIADCLKGRQWGFFPEQRAVA